MTFYKWVVFVVSLSVILFMWALGDLLLAGVVSVCVSLFEAEIAFSVFKWVFTILLFLEALFTIPSLYNVIKNRKDLR